MIWQVLSLKFSIDTLYSGMG